MAILIECIPLKPPDEGWKANYAFWVRLYVSSLPIAFGAVFQVKEVIEPEAISKVGIAVTGVGSCTCYVALTIAVAALWKFPIPFGYVLTVAPFVFFYMVFFVLSVGPRVLAKSPTLRHQIVSQMTVIAAQGVLAVAYPTFSAIFNQLSGYQQTVFFFVLPLIKFSVKQVIAKASAHLQEYVGLIVVFSVDVCNVLYIVVCMQTATSPVTTTLVITSDAFFVLLALRSIYYQLDASQGLRNLQSMNSTKSYYLQDLLELIRGVFQDAAKDSPTSVLPRIHSPVPLPISTESRCYINDLVPIKRSARDSDFAKWLSMVAKESARAKPTLSHNQTDIERAVLNEALSVVAHHRGVLEAKLAGELSTGPKLPLEVSSRTFSKSLRLSTRRISVSPTSQSTPVQDAQDALQALFHSEYVIMAEYIECVIPVLYSVYLTFLFHLPTAAYYPHTRSLTHGSFVRAQTNLLLYSLVEFTSFASVTVLLKRKFGFSPLYQLAFVLETQTATLQGHLFLWISVILQMTLVHNGVDLETPFKNLFAMSS